MAEGEVSSEGHPAMQNDTQSRHFKALPGDVIPC
jgi:hypothetical protein